MKTMRQIEAKLLSLHTDLEDAGLDNLSLQLSSAVREVRCAAAEEINVTSWDDFQRFWEKNRGEQLVFVMIDQYGPEHPIVKQVKELVTKNTELDRDIHELYMKLKGAETPEGTEEKPDKSVEALKNLEDES
jgi:hypothetical protein